MELFYFLLGLIVSLLAIITIIVIQDERRIKSEKDIRRCTQTDCYFNDGLTCRSLSDTWHPALLDCCPDYTED